MVIYTMMPKLNNPLEIQKYKYVMDISWPNKNEKEIITYQYRWLVVCYFIFHLRSLEITFWWFRFQFHTESQSVLV